MPYIHGISRSIFKFAASVRLSAAAFFLLHLSHAEQISPEMVGTSRYDVRAAFSGAT
jgi:hypothetical protein